MTGFDSEADRRDAIRKQIVDECMRLIYETISKNVITNTLEERTILILDIILALMSGSRIEAQQELWKKEILDAESKL